jgi:protoporphyrin/coproporphyrin ferrochelatase
MTSELFDPLFLSEAGGILPAYDAILIVGFGGPEGRDDVLPFLENVTRGRNVPRARLLEVAEHYDHFGGVSPINSQVRALISALRPELERHGIALPIYWGNRNWHPLLADTLARMTGQGVKRALAVVLASCSSYSSCRQYREDIARAQAVVGASAPLVDKVRVFYNHPEFIAANADRVGEALGEFSADCRTSVDLAFTAHSIPAVMARSCDYEHQLGETCRSVAGAAGVDMKRWKLVYQSRSGRPGDPWLEPDVLDHLKGLKDRGSGGVLIHPIGFLSDHVEVLYDLDHEARLLCEALELKMVRSRTVGTHPRFVSMLRELIAERLDPSAMPRNRAVGADGPSHDRCPQGCCLARVPDDATTNLEIPKEE